MEFAKEQAQIIVKNINRLIKERHMLKGDFYKAVGISSAGFSQWNVGATVPSMQKLTAAADVLGVDVTDLLTENGIKKEPIPQDGLDKDIKTMAEMFTHMTAAERQHMIEYGGFLKASALRSDNPKPD